MVNESGLRPLGRAVLVELYEPERKRGMIHIPEIVKERTTMVEQRAIVVESGPAAWQDEATPRAQPGDKVLVTKYAGYLAKGPKDGKLYRIVNENDVFCAITAEADFAAIEATEAV